ncbi:uncharacterized protein LOC131891763 isoform X1 [Tigriopus californicus]|uniref:uncharacterized protein LOC131891763 isoform X1 n=1 Tax=Tigriopus californicus TaxID=6832 RepID=UPI0027DA65FC|nr:uncharacterized protein LOC131891763 isoform X1 [Tigriopus californicus]
MRHFLALCLFRVIQAQIGIPTYHLCFQSTPISSTIFQQDKIGEISNSGSVTQCAIQCTRLSNCSRFMDDGKKCHLLQKVPFLQEVLDHGPLVNVHEIQEWSHVMILGGYTTDGGAINDIEVLNLKTMKHCSNPFQLPEGRYGGATYILDRHLNYALGADNDGERTDTFQLDFRYGTWKTTNLLTPPMVYSISTQIDPSRVLLVGGQNVSRTTIVHSNGSVFSGPPLPHDVFRHCVLGVDEQHIFVAGGVKTGIGRTKDTLVLNWSDQVWVAQDPMVHFHRSVTCDTFLDVSNRLSILVGQSSFEIFTWSTRKWRAGPDMLGDYNWGNMVRFDGILYFMGGKESSENTRSRKIFSFDPKHETWSRVPLDLQTGRTSFGIAKIPPGVVNC